MKIEDALLKLAENCDRFGCAEVSRAIMRTLQDIAPDNSSTAEILAYLNEKAGTAFRSGASMDMIRQRLAEKGVTVEGCKQMIDRQCKLWGGTDMAQYLRPATLFNKTKFDCYYGSKHLPIHEHQKPHKANPSELRNAAIAGSGTANATAAQYVARQSAQRTADPVAKEMAQDEGELW